MKLSITNEKLHGNNKDTNSVDICICKIVLIKTYPRIVLNKNPGIRIWLIV